MDNPVLVSTTVVSLLLSGVLCSLRWYCTVVWCVVPWSRLFLPQNEFNCFEGSFTRVPRVQRPLQVQFRASSVTVGVHVCTIRARTLSQCPWRRGITLVTRVGTDVPTETDPFRLRDTDTHAHTHVLTRTHSRGTMCLVCAPKSDPTVGSVRTRGTRGTGTSDVPQKSA